MPQRGGEATVPLPPALLQQRGKQVPAFTWCWEAGMCASSWFMKGKSRQFSITPPKTPPRTRCLCIAAHPLLRGFRSCIQPSLLSGDSRLWVARAPCFLTTPLGEFLSTLCTMSSPSSLPALPLTIYGCAARSRSHLCPSSAPAQDRVPLTAAASTQCSVPEPAARWQLHPLGIWGLPNADFPKMYKFRGGGNSPRNIKTFRWVLMLLNH